MGPSNMAWFGMLSVVSVVTYLSLSTVGLKARDTARSTRVALVWLLNYTFLRVSLRFRSSETIP